MPALLALLSSVLWGTADFLGGTLSRRRAVLAVVAASQVCGFVVMVVVALAVRAWTPDLAWLPWAVGASLSGFTGLVLFYGALARGTMGIVSPIASLGVLVPLAVGLLGGEVPAPLQYLGIVLAVVGIVLASGPELSGQASLQPVLMALGSALMFGISLTCIAKGSATSVLMTMTGMRATSTLIALVLLLAVRSSGGLVVRDVPMLVAIGAFDVLANVSYGAASTLGLLAVVAVLGSLYPVVTVLLAWWVHHERLRPVQYAGVATALLGVAAISAGGA